VSQENIDVLRPIYESWEGGNLRAGDDVLDDRIESVWPPEFPSGGTYRGKAGHREAMRTWLSPWENFRLMGEGFFDVEDQVVVPFRVQARGRGSGIEVERRWAHVWTMRSGKAVRFEVYADPDQALKAVGLEK
jgi:ketosteroid isomerase-like protein